MELHAFERRLWVIQCRAHQSARWPLSDVGPIGDKLGGGRFVRKVPVADIAHLGLRA
jgi:hypothetical protein